MGVPELRFYDNQHCGTEGVPCLRPSAGMVLPVGVGALSEMRKGAGEDIPALFQIFQKKIDN